MGPKLLFFSPEGDNVYMSIKLWKEKVCSKGHLVWLHCLPWGTWQALALDHSSWRSYRQGPRGEGGPKKRRSPLQPNPQGLGEAEAGTG